MAKPTLKEQVEFYKMKSDAYEELLDYIRRKCKADGDLEFAVRKQMRAYLKIASEPMPGTPEHREKYGIPFEEE